MLTVALVKLLPSNCLNLGNVTTSFSKPYYIPDIEELFL